MDIKKISELFAIAVPPLILCSSIRSVTYYHTWNIPILDYLTPAELLFSFISPALVMMALAAAYLLFMIAFAGLVLLFAKLGLIRKGKEKSDGNEQKRENKRHESKGYQVFAWLSIVISLGCGIWVFFAGIWYEFKIVPVVIFHVFLWVVAIVTVDKLWKSESIWKSQSTEAPENRNKERASNESILLGTIVMLVSASFFYGRYQANQTLTHPSQLEIMLTDSSVIATSPNVFYLGRTANYCFLYDNSTHQVSIIPNKEIKIIRSK